MHREPSAHIFRNAMQFYEIALPACEDSALLSKTSMSIVCNFALAVELLLKSCDAGVKKGVQTPGAPPLDAEIYSNAWGHDLEKIFDDLDSSIRRKIEILFFQTSGQDLRPLLATYKDYFIHARYAHEPRAGHSYDISGIKDLAANLIEAIKKWNHP